MKTNYLLPPIFKMIGVLLFVPFIILGFFVIIKDFQFDWLTIHSLHPKNSNNFISENENFTNEIAIIGTLLSLFFIAFSREKLEDEFIVKTRLESLLWATYINLFLVIVVTLSIYGLNFYMAITNLVFLQLIIFILRFNFILNWKIRLLNKEGGQNEK